MKKILFNSKYGLEQAVLDGRKTMTRRIISCNADVYFSHWRFDNSHHWQLVVSKNGRQASLSRFARNEVVAIAQAYKDIPANRDFFKDADFIIKYKGTKGWNNKMFVRADIMPHHIKITNIKVERLQDISDEDCLREGVIADKMTAFSTSGSKESVDSFRCEGIDGDFISPREAFAALIDKVSGKGTWERNPWVFVYEFELID